MSKASWMMLICSHHWEPSVIEFLATGWVLCGHRNGIENIKRHSLNKELLYPKSELSLSCNPCIFVLTFKSKRQGPIFLKGTKYNASQDNPRSSFGRPAHSGHMLYQRKQRAPVLAPAAPFCGMFSFRRGSALAGSSSWVRSPPQVPIPIPCITLPSSS